MRFFSMILILFFCYSINAQSKVKDTSNTHPTKVDTKTLEKEKKEILNFLSLSKEFEASFNDNDAVQSQELHKKLLALMEMEKRQTISKLELATQKEKKNSTSALNAERSNLQALNDRLDQQSKLAKVFSNIGLTDANDAPETNQKKFALLHDFILTMKEDMSEKIPALKEK